MGGIYADGWEGHVRMRGACEDGWEQHVRMDGVGGCQDENQPWALLFR